MKPLVIASLVALVVTSIGPSRAAQIAQIGKAAPAFSYTALDGKRQTSAQFRGRPMFVNFFATWCPPCKLELPNIVKDYPAYRGRVIFLGLDQEESPELVRPFLKQYEIQYQIGIDEGQVGADYGVAAIPQSVFIDRHGVVRAIWRGYMPPKILSQNLALITK
ncbi:MAG: TlpA family protein disulfide reductase [Candidatus Eremiobacteraeota bacterium]|nr:TlpA family protein disulfide reductase [Candidatus Eremiobacteraeota bacterium]MBV8595627.1 TlpA family protein disulfide reductase [Candidatus Eremiobacteraeota bacterium]